jgi:hypothetical protein
LEAGEEVKDGSPEWWSERAWEIGREQDGAGDPSHTLVLLSYMGVHCGDEVGDGVRRGSVVKVVKVVSWDARKRPERFLGFFHVTDGYVGRDDASRRSDVRFGRVVARGRAVMIVLGG